MTLAALLRQIGRQPLGNQFWMVRLLETLNAVLPEAHRMETTSTGLAVLGALTLLPERERSHLLDADVNPLDGTLLYVETKIIPEDVDLPGIRGQPTDRKGESFHQEVMNDLVYDGRRAFLVLLSVGLMLVAVGIVLYTVSVYDKHPKDGPFFLRLLRAFLDLLDALTGNFQPNNQYVPQ